MKADDRRLQFSHQLGRLFIKGLIDNSRADRFEEYDYTTNNPVSEKTEDERAFLWRDRTLAVLVGYYL